MILRRVRCECEAAECELKDWQERAGVQQLRGWRVEAGAREAGGNGRRVRRARGRVQCGGAGGEAD